MKFRRLFNPRSLIKNMPHLSNVEPTWIEANKYVCAKNMIKLCRESLKSFRRLLCHQANLGGNGKVCVAELGAINFHVDYSDYYKTSVGRWLMILSWFCRFANPIFKVAVWFAG